MKDSDLRVLRMWMRLRKTIVRLERLKRLVVWMDGMDGKHEVHGAFWWDVSSLKEGNGAVLVGRKDIDVSVGRIGKAGR